MGFRVSAAFFKAIFNNKENAGEKDARSGFPWLEAQDPYLQC
jgi:hypothetical protein